MKYTISGECSPKSPCAISAVTLTPRKRTKGQFVFPPIPSEIMESSNPSTTSSIIQFLEPYHLQDNLSRADLISNGSSGISSLTSAPGITHRKFREGDNSDKTSFVSRCTFTGIILALTLVYICTAGMSFCFIYRLITKCSDLEEKINNANMAQVAYQQSPHLCLPCDNLAQGPFDEDNKQLSTLIQKIENNTKLCCAGSSEQISVLLDLFARRKQLAKCAQELLSDNSTRSANCNASSNQGSNPAPQTPLSAHLYVGPKQDKEKVNGENAIRDWKFDAPGTHLKGITLSNDKLVVPETGLYFVYSQLGFLVYYDNDENSLQRGQSIFHKVMRYNAIYPLKGTQTLLSSELTQCWEKKDYGRYKSYIGASMELNKGDQLYVLTTRIGQLSKEPSLSYFGLYKVR